MKKTILAALIAAASVPAMATDYFVVVPVPNRTATASNMQVSLNGYSLPSGLVGRPYAGFDFTKLLSVTGDPGYTGYGVHWSVVSGSLPAGLTLNPAGKLSGTPTAASTSSFQVMVAYKTKAGQQAYQVFIGNVIVGLAAGSPPQATVGQAYAYDLKPLLSVTGDSAYDGSGVTWSMVSSTLPAGLYLTSDGWIGGTPTANGTGSITARATYHGVNGQQTYQVVTFELQVALAADTAMPVGVQGAQYSYDLKPRLSVSGDPQYTLGQVTWSLASGELPAGLQLNADGTISGTPSAEGTYPFTVQASYKTKTGQQTYSVLVGAITISLASAQLPGGEQGATYRYDLKPKLAIAGDAAYSGAGVTWSVASGTLPAGLSLGSDGVITGTPTAENSGTPFTIQAAYKTKTGQQAYAVVVGAITITLTSAQLPGGEQGAAYTYDLKPKLAIAGDAAYSGSGVTWSVVSGALPVGLSLSANGVISGTPTAENAGTPFTIQAAYKTKTGQQAYAVVVGAIAVTLTGSTAPGATLGQSYNSGNGWDIKANLSITNDAAYAGNGTGVTWSVTGGALPAGLTLNSNGTVTGTPTAAGTNPVQVTATYKTKSGAQNYTISYTGGITQYSGYRAWSDGTLAKSCLEYRNGKTGFAYAGATGDGIYRIDVDGAGALTPVDVVCDMTNDGGGWTTFQRRTNGAVNFYQGYAAYAAGFGSAATEYWIGNDRLAALSAAGATNMRVDLTRYTGATGYAKYTGFKIAAASDNYRITSGTYIAGTIGDSMAAQNGMQFSTFDKDELGHGCAVTFKGAWWYASCHASNLNGYYYGGVHTSYADGMEWDSWTGYYESMVKTEMKVR
jgi:hypothetical protein